jgi:putative hydrolase of HD superfamily
MSDDRLESIIRFLKEIEKLKHVHRQVYLSDNSKNENSAEHSWHMCLILMALEKELSGIDLLRAYKMILVHDLVEIYSGDVCFVDNEKRKQKQKNEEKAAERLFSMLPEDLREEFLSIWREFEKGQTKESLVVHSLDKLQAMIQQIISDGKGWREWNVTNKDIIDYKKDMIESNPLMVKIQQSLFEEIRKLGLVEK